MPDILQNAQQSQQINPPEPDVPASPPPVSPPLATVTQIPPVSPTPIEPQPESVKPVSEPTITPTQPVVQTPMVEAPKKENSFVGMVTEKVATPPLEKPMSNTSQSKDEKQNPETPPSPLVPKIHKSKKYPIGALLTVFLLLAVTVPLSVYYLSQKESVAEIRNKAAAPECTGYSFDDENGGKCDNAGACRIYSECCAPGKSRVVKATCLINGQEQFDITSSCDDAGANVSACGVATNPGPVENGCKPGEFFWAEPDGDNACHDISAPRNPGGASGTCTKKEGCNIPEGGGCLKGFKCTKDELTPQGFCLNNEFTAEENSSYQDEADEQCVYVQVDAYNQKQCDAGINKSTPHKGAIIYKPNNPDCNKDDTKGGGGGGGGQGGGKDLCGKICWKPGDKGKPKDKTCGAPESGLTCDPIKKNKPEGKHQCWANSCNDKPTPTPTDEPIAVCKDIKIYKDDVVVNPKTLEAGDEIVIAVVGVKATKARIKINKGEFTETKKKNKKGEFILSYTIPADIEKFSIQAEVFRNKKWK